MNGRDFSITDREKEILSYLSTGAKNIDIANTLNISEKTLKSRPTVIYEKLNAQNRTHAVIIAIQQDIIKERGI